MMMVESIRVVEEMEMFAKKIDMEPKEMIVVKQDVHENHLLKK
jgi:hypothetical protein